MTGPACHAPFVSMEFDPAGNVFTCCANQLYPMGHVADASLAEIWRGPRAQALRAALGAGDLTSGCNSCRWAMAHGNDAPIARLYDAYPVTALSPAHPSRMTFALSNRCNLECVMCNGELSSRIRAREGRAPLPPAYGDAFFAQLDEFLPHLTHASFLGGEPFLIAENFRVWEQMRALGLQTRCAVVTNATRLDAKVEAALGSLPFDVTVSLDGVNASTVEGIRRNLDLDEAIENARRFRDYAEGAGTAFGFNFCLTTHNWRELGAFLAFADGWDADVRVISVSEPGHSLHDLDEGALREVLAALEAEDAERGATLTRNRDRWQVEVEQVRRVLAERRQGVEAPIRQPQAMGGASVELAGDRWAGLGDVGDMADAAEVAVAADAEARALERITRWAHGGPVARVLVGADRRVRAVDGDLAGDGRILPEDAVGADVDDLLRRSEAAAGRDFYAVERWEDHGVVDQTFLAADGVPSRGGAGSVVRVITVPTPAGSVAFVAADRFYDRGRAVAVRARA